MDFSEEFVSVGGNIGQECADWSSNGIVAYGAHSSIALWKPQALDEVGVRHTLEGHASSVRAIKFFPHGPSLSSPDLPSSPDRPTIMLSGASDASIMVWRSDNDLNFRCVQTLNGHKDEINCLAVMQGHCAFVSGASDYTIKVWTVTYDDCFTNGQINLMQTIDCQTRSLNRYIPNSISLCKLENDQAIMIVGGTSFAFQWYTCANVSDFTFQQPKISSSLWAHKDWIQSVHIIREDQTSPRSDWLVASAGSDKKVRIWRVQYVSETRNSSPGSFQTALLPVVANFDFPSQVRYGVMAAQTLDQFEDAVNSVRWAFTGDHLRLLTACDDGSITIWKQDGPRTPWRTEARHGQIMNQSGSNPGLGLGGGFAMGLWSPDRCSVIGLQRTGGWMRWTGHAEDYSKDDSIYSTEIGISGHTRRVNSICWTPSGAFLLSGGFDMTARLYGERDHLGSCIWHELARPQVHGSQIHSVAAISDTQFVSGAEEKLLRVFEVTKVSADILEHVCGLKIDTSSLAYAASAPGLDLSNSAQQVPLEVSGHEGPGMDASYDGGSSPSRLQDAADIGKPPTEGLLAGRLCWTEQDKLYGPPDRISTIAISDDRCFIATASEYQLAMANDTKSRQDACRIHIYGFVDGQWKQSLKPLHGHTQAVTDMQYSHDNKYLLSVGHDRQWIVWKLNNIGPHSEHLYDLEAQWPNAHRRVITACAWVPESPKRTFLTAGLDKEIKLWTSNGPEGHLHNVATVAAPVWHVSVLPFLNQGQQEVVIAYGTGSGGVGIVQLGESNAIQTIVPPELCPKGCGVTQVKWRPGRQTSSTQQLAVGSDNGSIRILVAHGLRGLKAPSREEQQAS